MTAEAGAWVLDTSIVVHVLRGTPLGRRLVDKHQLRARAQVSIISVVTVGELLSLERQLNWGSQKVSLMRELLAELVIADINTEPVLNAYAEIDAWCRQNGSRPGKNDIWIAATAAATESELLTTDKDFDVLHGRFFRRLYFDPATGI